MTMILTCRIDLDKLVWRDQAKALNAMAELEDLGLKEKIGFDWKEEEVKTEEVTKAEPTTGPMPEAIQLDSAEVKIMKALMKLKRATFRQIQEVTELQTGTLSPNLSRMVIAGKLEKHSPAGATKRTSRDQIDYSIPTRR